MLSFWPDRRAKIFYFPSLIREEEEVEFPTTKDSSFEIYRDAEK